MKARLEYKDGTFFKDIEVKEWRDVLKISIAPPIHPASYFHEGVAPIFVNVPYRQMTFQWTHDNVWICIESR